MERKGIIAAGNWVFDNVKILDTLPEPGMLGSIIDEDFDGGGAPFNVLVDLAKITNNIPLYGAGLIGEDFKGDFVRNKLKQNNIDITFLETTTKAPTSYTDVMTEKNTGARTFFHCRGANALLDYNHFEPLDTNAKIFHLGYLLLLDKLDREDKEFGVVSAKVLKLLKDKGYKTSVDVVSESGDRFKKLVTPALKYIDYLIINEIEAERITGIKIRDGEKIIGEALKKAASELLKEGVNELVVIHFPEGGFVKSQQEEIFVPSWFVKPDEIAGSNGAGDAFCAGMLYSIHEGLQLEKSLKIANAAARFNLQNATSTGGAVSIKKIQEYIETARLRESVI
jgi:sugar/nucleoside kinase (ribokinase family)